MTIDSAKSVAPWLEANWQQLQDQQASKALAHAMLFTGGLGIGKHEFLLAFSAYLLCPNATLTACGRCHVCELLRAGTCPDYVLLTPEEDSRVITIDAVREILQFIYKTPQIARNKVVLIDPADALNVNAANALLKGLEEPPANTYFLLSSASPSRLPATIRSRCRRMRMNGPTEEQARQFLSGLYDKEQIDSVFAVMGSSPYQAVDGSDKLIALVEALDSLLEQQLLAGSSGAAIAEILLTLEAWPIGAVLDAYVRKLNYLSKVSLGSGNDNDDSRSEKLAKALPPASWVALAFDAQALLQTFRRGISLNVKLSLESLLTALQERAKQSCRT